MGDLPHPAFELLREWQQHGASCQTSAEPWSLELKDQRFEAGCHRSATEHFEFLREELADFIENKF